MADSHTSRWQETEPSMMALDEIAVHPANVRTTLTDLDELASSIARQGLTRPLEVMPADRVAAAWPEYADTLTGKPWVLLSGHRRLAAARRVHAQEPHKLLPVLIRRDQICDDRTHQVDAMITDAVASRSLTPIEQARAFESVRGAGHTQTEIAERYGCTQGHVSQQLTLLRLPEEIQQAVERRELPVREALRLARLDDKEAMRGAWGLYVNEREDAWITSADQAIAEYADRTAYQARREAALAQAAGEGIQVVDPVEEFGRELANHRLTEPERLAEARAAGTLVAGISGDGELEYYTTRPPARPAGPDSDQRRAAAAARERAGRLLAAQRPPELPEDTAEPLVDAFLRTAPDGWRPIARRWLRWLQLGPEAENDPGRWWEGIYAADWETRSWAAHCLTLAGREHRARTHKDWDQADRAWLWRLVSEAGYVPRPWERQRLGEGHDDRAPETETLPAAAPPGWFEPYQQCPAITWLTGADLAWLERDPKRFHEAEQLQQCHLEAGHSGRHAALAQEAGAEHYPEYPDRTGVLALWAWWRDPPRPGRREEIRIAPAEPCPATGPDQEPCLLYAGHPGSHG